MNIDIEEMEKKGFAGAPCKKSAGQFRIAHHISITGLSHGAIKA
jgi:hypothetical protein